MFGFVQRVLMCAQARCSGEFDNPCVLLALPRDIYPGSIALRDFSGMFFQAQIATPPTTMLPRTSQ
jgi:hypothetical protein